MTEEVTFHSAGFQRIAAVQTLEAKIQVPEPLTVNWTTPSARSALTAGLEREHHVVANAKALYSGADPFHDTRSLMTEDHRRCWARLAEVVLSGMPFRAFAIAALAVSYQTGRVST